MEKGIISLSASARKRVVLPMLPGYTAPITECKHCMKKALNWIPSQLKVCKEMLVIGRQYLYVREPSMYPVSANEICR